jgi:hypothetical protein
MRFLRKGVDSRTPRRQVHPYSAGLLAAIAPARRGSGLKVLQALQYE